MSTLKTRRPILIRTTRFPFRGGMERTFYSKVDSELNVLPENRFFPEPGNEGKIMEIIDKYGKLDMVFGGVGINGHYAFNEPPEPGENVTPEEFAERRTLRFENNKRNQNDKRIYELRRQTLTLYPIGA